MQVSTEKIKEKKPRQAIEHTKKGLLKSAGTVSSMTFLSRILGLARDIASASLFGTSRVWDAFVIAFVIPNLLRRVVGEGALSSAFIPVYAEVLREKGAGQADRLTNVVQTLTFSGLAVLLVAVHFAVGFTLGNFALSAKVTMVLEFLQLLFPYILFLSLAAVTMGALHCRRRFLVPSLSPVVLNIAWILAVTLLCPLWAKGLAAQAKVLAAAILLAGAAQFAFQLAALIKEGYRPKFVFEPKNTYALRTFKLMSPAALGFAIVQFNILVDMLLAFTLGDGANSSLWYGNRLMQFPLGVFAIAMGTALLPTMSHQSAAGDTDGLRSTLSFSLRSVFLIIIPASIGLIALREPIVRVLFERGSFDAHSTARTSATLLCYSLGLFAYSGSKVVTSGFYSLQDTKTPVKVGVFCMFTNLAFNLMLMGPLCEAGLALATAVSGTVQFLVLGWLLRRKVGDFGTGEIAFSFLKMTLAGLVMAAAAVGAFNFASSVLGGANFFLKAASLAAAIAAAVACYVGAALVLRINEIRRAFSLFGFGGKVFGSARAPESAEAEAAGEAAREALEDENET